METNGTSEVKIPKWLAESLVPSALLMALVSSLVLWRDVALTNQYIELLKPRLEAFEQFRLEGGRFTADDGERLSERISDVERRVVVLELANEYNHRDQQAWQESP